MAQLRAGPNPVEVYVLDAFTYASHRGALEEIGRDAGAAPLTICSGDIAEPGDLKRAFAEARPTHVLNLAAETHVDRSLLDASPFLRTNIEGTQQLLQHIGAARAAKVRKPRFVQVSTDEVYGDRSGRRPAREGDAVDPTNPYAASKACADALVLAAVRTRGLDALVTRGCNTYGPGQFPEKLLPLAARRWAEGEPMWLYGDGLHERVWLHVDDHARGIVAAARGGRAGCVYHFRGSVRRSNRAALSQWWRALGHRGLLEEALQAVADRPGHDRSYALSDAETRRQLGWKPTVAWRKGLDSTARWWQASRDFWDEALSHPAVQGYFEEQYGRRTPFGSG